MTKSYDFSQLHSFQTSELSSKTYLTRLLTHQLLGLLAIFLSQHDFQSSDSSTALISWNFMQFAPRYQVFIFCLRILSINFLLTFAFSMLNFIIRKAPSWRTFGVLPNFFLKSYVSFKVWANLFLLSSFESATNDQFSFKQTTTLLCNASSVWQLNFGWKSSFSFSYLILLHFHPHPLVFRACVFIFSQIKIESFNAQCEQWIP